MRTIKQGSRLPREVVNLPLLAVFKSYFDKDIEYLIQGPASSRFGQIISRGPFHLHSSLIPYVKLCSSYILC